MLIHKFNPHKTCSCKICKLGRTKKNRVMHEKNYRRNQKILLNKLKEEFIPVKNATGYTD